MLSLQGVGKTLLVVSCDHNSQSVLVLTTHPTITVYHLVTKFMAAGEVKLIDNGQVRASGADASLLHLAHRLQMEKEFDLGFEGIVDCLDEAFDKLQGPPPAMLVSLELLLLAYHADACLLRRLNTGALLSSTFPVVLLDWYCRSHRAKTPSISSLRQKVEGPRSSTRHDLSQSDFGVLSLATRWTVGTSSA